MKISSVLQLNELFIVSYLFIHSERADPSSRPDFRKRLTEGANINKSLVTLGYVIKALGTNISFIQTVFIYMYIKGDIIELTLIHQIKMFFKPVQQVLWVLSTRNSPDH